MAARLRVNMRTKAFGSDEIHEVALKACDHIGPPLVGGDLHEIEVELLFKIAPPDVAVLSVKTQLVTSGLDSMMNIPPPLSEAWLAVMVQFVKVSDDW